MWMTQNFKVVYKCDVQYGVTFKSDFFSEYLD